jgi:diphthamide biosynthesis methyltransferase
VADRIYREAYSQITLDRAIVKTQTHLDREISMSADRKLYEGKAKILYSTEDNEILFDTISL